MVLLLISTLNDGNAIRRLLLHQYPQFTQPLDLMRVSYAFILHWESLVMVKYSLPLLNGDRLNFSSHLKCSQPATHQRIAAVTSSTIGTDMLAFVFDN